MTNEEKIIEILDRHFGYHVNQGSDEWYTRNYQNRFADLLEMAEWKDERIKSCFIFISKLIKENVLTKDNPEHIMVKQMMELYNNLKM